MANAMFSESFLKAAGKSFFNASEWTPVGDAFSLKDIWAVTNPKAWESLADGDETEAEVICQEFSDGSEAMRLRVPFKDGSSIDLKLSGRSSLEEGDKVKVNTIKGQELRKMGQDNILRYDGELAE